MGTARSERCAAAAAVLHPEPETNLRSTRNIGNSSNKYIYIFFDISGLRRRLYVYRSVGTCNILIE